MKNPNGMPPGYYELKWLEAEERQGWLEKEGRDLFFSLREAVYPA